MTQIELARNGVISDAVKRVAEKEEMDPEAVAIGVAEGTIAIPSNPFHRQLDPVGIGKSLSIKVNANVGTSRDHVSTDEEIEKVRIAIASGADAIMDLSTGGDLAQIRKTLLDISTIPFGTVPIYEAAVETAKREGGIIHITPDILFDIIEAQAKDGVDFMTIHAGLTLKALERLRHQGRVTDIVSRGGAFLTAWMLHHGKENPFYTHFDRLLSIARQYDITLSLGDGLRPGCVADATDRAQIDELLTLGELTQAAWGAGVQVMIEGPGHVPLDQIETNVILQKRLCHGAPFYVLGPIVTDVAAGYDHIACAIGGALAGKAGADFLCYVTPSEHLKLPSTQDVKEGVIAARIAAHAADLAKGRPNAMDWDLEMARARKALDWDRQIMLSIDPEKSKTYRNNSLPSTEDVCTMCGEFCAIKLVRDYFET
jgi:phosphomethylpyrimidine synthase